MRLLEKGIFLLCFITFILQNISISYAMEEENYLHKGEGEAKILSSPRVSLKPNQGNDGLDSNNSYVHVDQKKQYLEDTEKETFRILSIDGGGIRGIIPATILEILEQRLGFPISYCFDLIAGTSTGGIIALGLNVPKEDNSFVPRYMASELKDLYEKEGEHIFQQLSWWGKLKSYKEKAYNPLVLENILEEYFENNTLSQSVSRVVITAYEVMQNRPYLFDSHESKIDKHLDFTMKDVARATSAAPTFFSAANIKDLMSGNKRYFIDGGVFANNPTFEALLKAKAFLSPRIKKITILSLGTGEVAAANYFDKIKDGGKIQWASKIPDVMITGATSLVSDHMSMLKEFLKAQGIECEVIRIQPSIADNHGELDNASAANIEKLKAVGIAEIEKNKPVFDKLIECFREERSNYEKILLRKADEGNSEAQYKFGVISEGKLDYISADKWYLLAANQGYPYAQFTLGIRILERYKKFDATTASVSEQQTLYTDAIKWLEKAANNGLGIAQYRLGLESEGFDEKQKWLTLCANNEFSRNYQTESEYYLGRLYEDKSKGKGKWSSSKDPSLIENATQCYEKAAKKNHLKSAFRLSRMLQKNNNSGAAKKWTNFAAKKGHPHALYFKAQLLAPTSKFSQEALDNYQAVINHSHSKPEYRAMAKFQIGEMYYIAGKYDLAQECYIYVLDEKYDLPLKGAKKTFLEGYKRDSTYQLGQLYEKKYESSGGYSLSSIIFGSKDKSYLTKAIEYYSSAKGLNHPEADKKFKQALQKIQKQ